MLSELNFVNAGRGIGAMSNVLEHGIGTVCEDTVILEDSSRSDIIGIVAGLECPRCINVAFGFAVGVAQKALLVPVLPRRTGDVCAARPVRFGEH